MKITRRQFLMLAGLGVVAGAVLGKQTWTYITEIEPAAVEVTNVSLKLPRLAAGFQGFRIAQVSDIHLGGWMNRAQLERVVEMTLALKPDLVALTGDFLTGHHLTPAHQGYLKDLAAALAPLARACPVYGVLGNHDYWTDAVGVRRALLEAGVRELANDFVTLTRGEARLHLAGVDDVWEGHADLNALLAALPTEDAAILLAHEPDFADVVATHNRFDLQLSGHSHGGQVVLPLLGPPVLPHLGQKYPAGLYQVQSLRVYTNRGVGMADLAVRLNCPPEITLFELQTV